jgi:hypothetical protein
VEKPKISIIVFVLTSGSYQRSSILKASLLTIHYTQGSGNSYYLPFWVRIMVLTPLSTKNISVISWLLPFYIHAKMIGKPKIPILVFVLTSGSYQRSSILKASLLTIHYTHKYHKQTIFYFELYGVKAKTAWFRIRIMCMIGHKNVDLLFTAHNTFL